MWWGDERYDGSPERRREDEVVRLDDYRLRCLHRAATKLLQVPATDDDAGWTLRWCTHHPRRPSSLDTKLYMRGDRESAQTKRPPSWAPGLRLDLQEGAPATTDMDVRVTKEVDKLEGSFCRLTELLRRGVSDADVDAEPLSAFQRHMHSQHYVERACASIARGLLSTRASRTTSGPPTCTTSTSCQTVRPNEDGSFTFEADLMLPENGIVKFQFQSTDAHDRLWDAFASFLKNALDRKSGNSKTMHAQNGFQHMTIGNRPVKHDQTLRDFVEKQPAGEAAVGIAVGRKTPLYAEICELLQRIGEPTGIEDAPLRLAGLDIAGVGANNMQCYIKIGNGDSDHPERNFVTPWHYEFAMVRSCNIVVAAWNPGEKLVGSGGLSGALPESQRLIATTEPEACK